MLRDRSRFRRAGDISLDRSSRIFYELEDSLCRANAGDPFAGADVGHASSSLPDEILLGRIAVRAGFVTQAQLDEAVAVQERSTPAPTLGAILIEFGYITPKMLAEILELQRAALFQPHATTDESLIDSLFGKLAVKLGYATPEQVNECIRLQAKQAAIGDRVKLGRLLVDKGYIKEEHVRRILRLQHIDLVGCPKCGKWYDSQGTPPTEWPACKYCGGPMSRLADLGTIDAAEILAGAAETLADDVAPVRRPRADVNQPPRRQERQAGRQENNIIEEAALQGRQRPSTTTRPNADALGQFAVQRGWITRAQLDESLTIQQRGGPPCPPGSAPVGVAPPLGQVLLKQGYLKPAQLDALVAGQDKALAKKLKLPPLSAKESRLGNLAVKRGYLTQERLDAALRERARNAAVGYEQALGTVLVQKGYLSRAQVDHLLRKQSRVRRVIAGRHRQAAASQAGWVAAAAGLLAVIAWGVMGGGAGLPSRPDGSRATSPSTARRTAPPPQEKYGEELVAREVGGASGPDFGGAGRSLPRAEARGARPDDAWTPPKDSKPLSSMARVPDGFGWEGSPTPTPEGRAAVPAPDVGPLAAASAATAAVEETSNKTSEPPPDLARYRIPWDRKRWLEMARELDALLAPPAAKEKPVYYLGEDWQTRGTWIGRYGTYAYILPAMNGPMDIYDSPAVPAKRIPYDFYIGENIHKFDGRIDCIRRWIHQLRWDDERVLQNPRDLPYRREAEFDNHHEAYPTLYDDIQVYMDLNLKTHPGWFVVSFYFFNKDGHSGSNRFRDYTIEFKDAITQDPGYEKRFDRLPVYARSRVHHFRGGVYHRYLVQGGRNYTARLGNNHSYNSILCGLFFDRIEDTTERSKPVAVQRLTELYRQEDELLALGTAKPSRLMANYVSRAEVLGDALLAVKRHRLPGYFPISARLHLALLQTCNDIFERFVDADGVVGVHALKIRALHELREFDERDAAVEQCLNYMERRVARASNRDSALGEMGASLDGLSRCPWVTPCQESPWFERYAYCVARYASAKSVWPILKDQDRRRRSLQARASLHDLACRLAPDGLNALNKEDAYEYVRILECIRRYEDAFSVCEKVLSRPQPSSVDRWLLCYARDLSRKLDRPDKAQEYARLLSERYR